MVALVKKKAPLRFHDKTHDAKYKVVSVREGALGPLLQQVLPVCHGHWDCLSRQTACTQLSRSNAGFTATPCDGPIEWMAAVLGRVVNTSVENVEVARARLVTIYSNSDI